MKVNSLFNMLNTIDAFFAHSHVLLTIIFCSFLLKFIFLFFLVWHWHKKTVHIGFLYQLTIMLVGSSLITDSAWIIKLVSFHKLINISYDLVITCIRIAWISFILQYQLIGLILEIILKKNYNLRFVLKINIPNFIFLISFCLMLIFDRKINAINDRFWLEPYLQQFLMGYLSLIFIPMIISTCFKKINLAPLISQRQFKIFLWLYVIPQVFSDFIHINPFGNANINSVTESYTFVAISTILLNLMIYFCARHIIQLRFLNFKKQIEHTKLDYQFDEVFQKGLIELGSVTTVDQLGEHVQNFFFRLFDIPHKVIQTHIHLNEKENHSQSSVCSTLAVFNSYLQKDHDEIIFRFFHNHGIAIRHELEFNNFYSPTSQDTLILELLSQLKTDLIVPIIYKNSILGYISIHDEKNHHYSLLTKSQRKATIIFASYLGSFAYILQNKRLETIEKKASMIENQLFESKQRLTYYQEGIETVLQEMQTTMTGLFIYHKKKFHSLNENIFNQYLSNKTFIDHCVSLINQKQGLCKRAIKINETELYCSSIALPHKNQFLITVQHQTVATKIQSFALENPDNAHSSCAFYIFATKKGKLIDSYFPYTTESFVHFKIKLMQIALNKKPVMLYGQKNDFKKICLLIHMLTKGNEYRSIDGYTAAQNSLSQLLFGVQDLYENNQTDKGLLETCNQGTLSIENIGLIPHQIQVDLAHFLSSGTYLPLKGFHTKTSSARIIVLNEYDNFYSMQSHGIIRNLEEILSQQTLYCPRLELISETEYIKLIQELLEKQLSFPLLKEQRDLIMHSFLIKRPQSIAEFEERINENLETNQHLSYEKNYYSDSKETIQQIIAQGKKSLKDPESMRILWNKFDKNQSYIASLLKVHRSSVNRRIKAYKL